MSDYFWAQGNAPVDPRWFESGAPVSSGWSLGAALSQAWNTSPGPEAMRFGQRNDLTSAQQGGDPLWEGPAMSSEAFFQRGSPVDPRQSIQQLPTQDRLLQPEEANRLYGIPNHLRFTRPTSELAAIDARDTRRAELVRRDALSRADGGVMGWTARMGASFLGAAMDPLNIASAFIPVIGPEMWAARVAEQSTRFGRAAVAARFGAIEGMAGQAMLEPANQLFAAAHQRDDDFGMAAALQNVAFGAVLGGVLHGGGRLVVDGWRGLPRMDPGVEREIHEAALRGAIAQIETGRAVDVDPVFQMVRSTARIDGIGLGPRPGADVSLGARPGTDGAAPPARGAAPDGVFSRAGEQIIGFQTARGSSYEVHADGTTTRDKAPRPEHPGDSGPKERSVATWFLTEENAAALAPPASASWRVIDNGDGTISLATRREDGQWGVSPSQRNIPVEAGPREGMIPFEVWGREDINGRTAYTTLHPGNPIVALRTSDLSPATPVAARAMAERASTDNIRSAEPEAWASAQAARSQDIGGARPRTETPVARVQADIAALDARIAEADAVLQTELAKGRLTPAELRSLDTADAETRARERGAGAEAAAACLIMNGARL